MDFDIKSFIILTFYGHAYLFSACGGVAQFVRAPNSNLAQWKRAQVDNQKDVDSLCGS